MATLETKRKRVKRSERLLRFPVDQRRDTSESTGDDLFAARNSLYNLTFRPFPAYEFAQRLHPRTLGITPGDFHEMIAIMKAYTYVPCTKQKHFPLDYPNLAYWQAVKHLRRYFSNKYEDCDIFISNPSNPITLGDNEFSNYIMAYNTVDFNHQWLMGVNHLIKGRFKFRRFGLQLLHMCEQLGFTFAGMTSDMENEIEQSEERIMNMEEDGSDADESAYELEFLAKLKEIQKQERKLSFTLDLVDKDYEELETFILTHNTQIAIWMYLIYYLFYYGFNLGDYNITPDYDCDWTYNTDMRVVFVMTTDQWGDGNVLDLYDERISAGNGEYGRFGLSYYTLYTDQGIFSNVPNVPLQRIIQAIMSFDFKTKQFEHATDRSFAASFKTSTSNRTGFIRGGQFGIYRKSKNS